MDGNGRQRLAIIQDLALRLIGHESFEDVLGSAVASTMKQLGFHECVVYLWNADTERLEPRAGCSRTLSSSDFLDRLRNLGQDEGIVGRSFRTCQPCIVADTETDPDYVSDDFPGRSEIAVPICAGSRCLGVIDSEHSEPGHFTNGDRDLLLLISSIIAPRIAIERTIDRLRKTRGELESQRTFVQNLIETAPNVLYLLDYQSGLMTEGLERFSRFLGYEREQVEALPKGVYDLVHPEDRAAIVEQETQLAVGGDSEVVPVEVRLRAAGGVWRWCLISSRVYERDDHGDPTLELGSVTDISSIKAAEAAEEAREKRFQALFENCFDCIVLYDRWATVVYSTPSVTRFTGYSDEETVGTNALDFVVPEDHAASVRTWFDLAKRPGGHAIIEQRIRHKDGHDVWIEARLTNRLDDPDVNGIVSNFHDITDRKMAEERINQLANYDDLTLLPNRRLLRARLAASLETARTENRSLTLFYMDLDRFKDVNDTLGHEVGDRLLRKVAEEASREAGEGNLLARLGGDEFALLVDDLELPAAAELAARLLATIEQPYRIDDYEVRLTASIGIARYPDHGEASDELFKHADIAMYRAKTERNRYSVFRSADARAMHDRVTLEKELQAAIEAGSFELWYQPRVCMRTETVVCVEALIRWRRDDGMLVLPGSFIPVAEETGLIYRIGEWVLDSACAQAARWRDAGRDLPISVNLSAHELMRADIIEQVARALTRHGIDGDRIELELTESAAMSNVEDGLETLRQLKALGVKLSIDDFGTGHSSLSYLRALPVDCLKIDQVFLPTQGGPGGGSLHSLITGIVLLAKSGGLHAVCEGVETAEQHRLLCDLGCDEAQGYYYAHPLPLDRLEALLDDPGWNPTDPGSASDHQQDDLPSAEPVTSRTPR